MEELFLPTFQEYQTHKISDSSTQLMSSAVDTTSYTTISIKHQQDPTIYHTTDNHPRVVAVLSDTQFPKVVLEYSIFFLDIQFPGIELAY